MFDQTEMYEQTEAFPKTRREFAEEFLSHFQADVEAAEKSLVNAQVKLAAARRIRDDGEENLRLAIRAEEGITDEPVVEADAEDAEDADFEPIAAIEGDVLDPITGEVVSKAAREDATGETNGPVGETDADYSETIPGEPETTPHVRVVRPDGQPFSVPIGEHTTYGELVADYLADNLIDLEPEDFNVVSEHGSARPLNQAIVPPDYGREFRIEAKAAEVSAA